jgi:hypothetical protein
VGVACRAAGAVRGCNGRVADRLAHDEDGAGRVCERFLSALQVSTP